MIDNTLNTNEFKKTLVIPTITGNIRFYLLCYKHKQLNKYEYIKSKVIYNYKHITTIFFNIYIIGYKYRYIAHNIIFKVLKYYLEQY